MTRVIAVKITQRARAEFAGLVTCANAPRISNSDLLFSRVLPSRGNSRGIVKETLFDVNDAP